MREVKLPKPCPDCGVEDTLFLRRVMAVSADVGEFSLAGVQTKFPVRERLMLWCSSCGRHRIGYTDGDYFVEDPTVRMDFEDEGEGVTSG